MAKWYGVFVIAPLAWLIPFVILNFLVGDTRASPWGMLAVLMISHVAPELGVTGLIAMATVGAFGITFVALFAAKIAPILSIAALGPDRQSYTSVTAAPDL
jgi:hypothetical protein